MGPAGASLRLNVGNTPPIPPFSTTLTPLVRGGPSRAGSQGLSCCSATHPFRSRSIAERSSPPTAGLARFLNPSSPRRPHHHRTHTHIPQLQAAQLLGMPKIVGNFSMIFKVGWLGQRLVVSQPVEPS